jgi:dTDP-4-dehydrorhamnose reductase
MKKKIIVTGGSGRFGRILKRYKQKNILSFPSKKELDILNYKKIENYLNKKKPDILIHLAGLSRPMNIHEKNIKKSIDLNIIGTANITKACEKKKIKLIYFSTNYVYPGIKGNYDEKNPLLPVNNYAWSKLGGEASVKLYKNSLILRVCMTEKPFIHKKAFANVKTNFIYHDEVVPILFNLLDQRGTINIGGKGQSIFKFAKKYNKNLKKSFLSKKKNIGIPFNSTMKLKKMISVINKKKKYL